MNSPTSQELHPIPTVSHVQWTRYVQVASLTLVLHDHLLTLPKEIDLVWRGANTRSWPRLLFFAARYACPIALIINTVALLDVETSDELYGLNYLKMVFLQLLTIDESISAGRAWLFFHGWSGYIFFAGVQVISQMRLWAIYRSTKVLIVMTTLVALALVVMGLIEGFGYSDLNVTSEPVPGIHICGPGILPHYIYAFWLPPIIVETVAVVLVMFKAAQYFKEDTPREWAGSRLMISIVKHSVFYFLIVLGVYVANFFVWLRLPINAFELVIPLTYALPSVAGNRMLLSLRSVFYDNHSMLPGQKDSISLTVVHPDRGLTVHTHNPLKEFDSFFGETSRSRT